ncbi:MAG: hypothetical protein HC915_03130 [Anaerolineae bacterium]|nr:hypothetical protein [Anaerolineae bacterium]
MGLQWLALLILAPAAGVAFGALAPTIIVLTFTVIVAAIVYITLWVVVGIVGGGRLSEIWLGDLALPGGDGALFLISAGLAYLLDSLWYLLIVPAVIGLMGASWVLGQLIQRYTFVDFKIAMRAMLATKGRVASTLLALVIGVFTLSVITMVVETIQNTFEALIEEAAGGNVFIFAADEATMERAAAVLDEQPGVEAYAALRRFDVSLVEVLDVSENENAGLRHP